MRSGVSRFLKIKPRNRVVTTIGIALITGLLGFIVGTRANDFAIMFGASQNKGLPSNLDFSSVQLVYDKLRQKFDGNLDASKLVEGAKKGLVDAAGDQYTVYFTADESKQFMSDLNGTFSGIGAELDKKDNQLIVVSTLEDSPAQKAGLQPQDKIMKVNDQDTTTWTLDKAVSQIRGKKGTTVKLTIVRGQDVKDYSIVRADIVTPSVKSEIIGDNVGYLRISRFADDTSDLAAKAAQDFKSKNVKGVVLDLRGDGGGYLTAAQQIASLWLNDKIVVEEKGDGRDQTLRSDSNAVLGDIPTVILVDGGSASASEIVAGALHDNNAAKLVGLKTFGKGSVQEIIDLPGGAGLKVTVAKWYTPGGKNISKEGIKPDTEVNISDDDVKNGRDPQKDKALELLK
jgi:carboxyl-terminal processing protease